MVIVCKHRLRLTRLNFWIYYVNKSPHKHRITRICVFVSVSQSACFLKISHLCIIVSFLVFKALPSLPDHLMRWCLAFFLLVFLNLFRLYFVIWACLLDWTDLLWWTNVAFCGESPSDSLESHYDSHLISYASSWKSPIYSDVVCWITVVRVKTKKKEEMFQMWVKQGLKCCSGSGTEKSNHEQK